MKYYQNQLAFRFKSTNSKEDLCITWEINFISILEHKIKISILF